ncbi:MAG: endolytic transglycosylase MltG [Caulobacterales bacterium]
MLGALITVAIALLLILGFAIFTFEGPGPKARSGSSTDVVLRAGAGVPEIAATLKRAGVIGSAQIFLAAAQVTGASRHLKAGEYVIPSGASLAKILDDIRHGRVTPHWVTIPEGVTSDTVMDILAKADFLTGVAPAPPEGAVLPETYEAQRGEDRAAVLQQMMDARDKLLAVLWSKRRADLPYKTPDEAVILASIVEKETARPDERPRVAAVFINRLNSGMKLESDPTVIYGITGGRPLGHGLKASELASQTPYNTYVIAGLPPGPIGNPGRASLAAVLDPPHTTELYFVADGTGGHVFSSSLEQHLKNVAHWRTVEAAMHNCQQHATGAGKPAGC